MGRKNASFQSLSLVLFALMLPSLVPAVYVKRSVGSSLFAVSLDTPDKFGVTPEEYETVKKLFIDDGIVDNEGDFQKHVKCRDRLNEIEREVRGINCSAQGQTCNEKFLQFVVREHKKNPHTTVHLYQGDMMLSPIQLDMICVEAEKRLAKFRANKEKGGSKVGQKSSNAKSRPPRHALMNPSIAPRWNINPIPYTITGNVVKADVQGAIELMQANTCLQFVYTPQLAKGQYGINFIEWDKYYCNSMVGMQSSDRQPQNISLPSATNGGCGILATIHEMCHAMSSEHEHTRSDREDYVNVVDSNIQSIFQGAFTEESNDAFYGSPYDYMSDMHYGPATFAIDGTKPNIEALNPDFQESFGQGSGMTHYDYYVLNQAYCQGKCQGIQGPNCTNSGYQDPLNCAQCKCPFMFTGSDCSILKESPSICNQTNLIAQQGVQQTLTLNGNTQCYISITASDGVSNINLYINGLDYGFGSPPTDTENRGCPYDGANSYVEVLTGPDFGLNGPRFCFYDDVYSYPLVSVGPKMYIFYNSMDSYWKGSFEANYYY